MTATNLVTKTPHPLPLQFDNFSMFTDHIHKSERLVYETIDPEQDLKWYQELRSDPSVAQWLLPFVIAPWSKAQAEKSLVTEGALVQ
jgi:hypothetical protein